MASLHAGMLTRRDRTEAHGFHRASAGNEGGSSAPVPSREHGTGGLVLFVFAVPAVALLIEAVLP